MKTIGFLVSLLLLNGCSGLRFYNADTKSTIECSNFSQIDRQLCVNAAMNSGYKLQGQ